MTHAQTMIPRQRTKAQRAPRWVDLLCWANWFGFVASLLLASDHLFAVIPAMVSALTMSVLSKARFDTPPVRGENRR